MASIFRQQYTTGGKKKKSSHWYIEYKTADGPYKRVRGFKDKVATAQLAAKLEKEAELAAVGLVDKFKEHRRRPLPEHLEDFRAALLNKGNTGKHADLVYNRAKAVLDGCGFVYMADMAASRVHAYLAERRRQGLSVRSSNFYLQAVKAFSRWLIADRRNAENPMAYLQGLNPKLDVRHERRALSVVEIDRLIRATMTAGEHSGMSDRARGMMYKLCLTTGLRASELASLTWGSFSLAGPTPSVTVLAAYSKHRRDDLLPMRVDVAQDLAAWQSETAADASDKVFQGFNPNKAAKMLRKDLERAGIEYQDPAGRFCDFHGLRHSYISLLTQTGASPKVAQSLARHSTIGLTMDVYTHVGLHDERAAIEGLPTLPNMGGACPQAQENRATGTDDRAVTTDVPVDGAYRTAYRKLTGNAFPESPLLSAGGRPEVNGEDNDRSRKTLSDGGLDTGCHSMAGEVTSEEYRRRSDLNRRITVLQTVALGHLATPPCVVGREGPSDKCSQFTVWSA